MTSRKGPLLILSGPSASGKSTLVERMLAEKQYPLHRSISATTRAPRLGEIDGIHYHFWTVPRFEQGIAAGELLEYAQVHGRDYYGTLRGEVDAYTEQGVGVILVIDVQGAAKVCAARPDAVAIFLLASSLGAYEQRLRERGTEDEAAIARRLATAQFELERVGEYQYVIVNDNLEHALAQFRGVLAQHF